MSALHVHAHTAACAVCSSAARRARFVLTPLASNASELVSSLRFAARKRPRAISLTLSQIYGAVSGPLQTCNEPECRMC